MTCILLVSVATNDYDASLGDKTGNKTLHIHFTVSVCVEQQTDQDHKDAAILDTHIFSSCFPFLYMCGNSYRHNCTLLQGEGLCFFLCFPIFSRMHHDH